MRQTIALILSISCFSLLGQSEVKEDRPILGRGVYLTATQLVFPEVILSYEHFVKKRLSLSYSLGYKIPVGEGSKVFEGSKMYNEIVSKVQYSTSFHQYRYMFMLNPFSQAFYISIAPAYYVSKRKRNTYIQAEIFNRFYWIDKMRLAYNEPRPVRCCERDTESFNSIRSEQINVTGIKILFGVNCKAGISKSTFLNLKAQAGVGFRYKTYHFENIDNNFVDFNRVQVYEEYSEKKGELYTPSLHLEIKIGVAKKQQLKTQHI
jgi:hypothetical protein